MKNFSGFRSKMFTILQVQISVIYKNFESIKCRDFVTELHFAGVKLFNQIKMTLSRLEQWEVF